MFLKYLSVMWTIVAPALGNHLWQSTLLVIAAGLLTLVLRKNRARARYWLWLAASTKFLLPFSLLVASGTHLPWLRGSAAAKTGWFFAMEQASQPFMKPATSMTPLATLSTAFSTLLHLLPAFLAAVWFCGFLAVLLVWYARWRRISAAMREAAPLREGREAEALRRLEQKGGMPKRIEMFLSRVSLEPGIFGITRPVLLWPEGVSERLEDAHLEAILAHELWHVRRGDNLAAALHMVVEAIFWFHPMVWWLGTRLVEERERACDEEVLESGSERQIYAESILRICEFCVGSPLTCVSGVTGADLKKRIERIMSGRVATGLDFSRKLLLSAAGLAVFAVPLVFGLLSTTQTHADSRAQDTTAASFAYESVSIKANEPATAILKSGKGVIRQRNLGTPNGLTITNTPVHQLIQMAYQVQEDRVSGAPDWLTSELYDVEAKIDSSTADKLQKLRSEQREFARGRMLQALLAEQFKLSVHRETKELPAYALLIAENGPKLQEATPGNTYPDGIKGPDGLPAGPGMMGNGLPAVGGLNNLTAQAIPMASLVQRLSWQMSRTVLDMTGLRDNYDFTLQWAPDHAAPEPSHESFVTAIQQQLGLKLEPRKALMEILVIDHVEKPSGR
jgi:bla regulator protein blaR1